MRKTTLLLLLIFLAPIARAQTASTQEGVLGEGTRWATPYFIVDSGKPGPCVVIVSGCHGNEPAGTYAADQIRHWPITRGKLIVVPRSNPPAIKVFNRYTPEAEKSLRNLNRNYGAEPRGEQAPRIWKLLKRYEPDWVLDLHEGSDFHNINKKSVGSSVIVTAEAAELGALLIDAVNQSVVYKDRRFLLLRTPVEGSLVYAAARDLGVPAMTLETTVKFQSLPFRSRQHRIMVHRLLQSLSMVDATVTPNRMTSRTKRTKVALYASSGARGKGVPRILGQLRGRKDVEIERVCITDVREGVLSQFDCVIFSGGSSQKQGKALGEAGRDRVRRFVGEGGGYIGICAGAYLATTGYSWGLNILDAKTKSPKWRRGRAVVDMEMTPAGREVFASKQKTTVIYHNGPLIEPAGLEGLADYETLAWFRSEVAEFDSPKGIMINSPAIVRGRYQKGHVVCISPHPEQTKTMEEWIRRAVRIVSR